MWLPFPTFEMSDITKLDISESRRQRGAIWGFITRLDDKVGELEAKDRLSSVDWLAAKGMHQRLSKLNKDFKRLHFAILDLLERQEDLELEQAVLDDDEDKDGNLKVCLQQLVIQDEPM